MVKRRAVTPLNVLVVGVVGVVIALAVLFAIGVVVVPGSVNAQPGVSAAGSPTEVVQRHYKQLSAGDYQVAWQELTPALQRQVSYAAWVNSFAASRVETKRLEVVSQSASAAIVAGTVSVSWSGAAPKASQGRWSLLLVDGIWRLDSASIDGVASSP